MSRSMATVMTLSGKMESTIPEGLVRRNHQSTALVAMCDELKQYLGLRIGFFNITDVSQ